MKNPNTSVKVVKKIDEAMAGSIFILSKIRGIKNPMEQAIIILAIIAKNKINPKYILWCQKTKTAAAKIPIIAPSKSPKNISLNMSL